MNRYDLVIQLGSQVKFVPTETGGYYELAEHTDMRTRAAVSVINTSIAPRLMILGGSNFGVRYDDQNIFNAQHPTQKTPIFTFEAFAKSDFHRKSEAAVIKDVLLAKYNVDPGKVLAETLSATTEENAEFLNIILKRRPMFTGNERIGILTLLYHMERALPVFRKAGLNVEPLFAENILAMSDDPINPMPSGNIDQICKYYSTPKSGKQYDVDRIRQLLTEGKSLEELIFPWWSTTVFSEWVCADGTSEELEKWNTYCIQAFTKEEAVKKLKDGYKIRVSEFENYVKGPFESLEQARRAY